MPSRLLTLAAAVSGAAAAFQGFNYGSTFTDGRPKSQTDFENEFKAAAGLDGTNGRFTSARLYTMVQGGTTNNVISAIPAAISTKTSLLLGLWASAGQTSFNNELAALKATITQYCGKLDGLVAGISVGSEDLYRITSTSQARSPDPGASPAQLVDYIKEVRNTIKGSCLEKTPIGHVDTWTAYANATNKPLIDAIDWVGMDAYSYYENTKPNGIENAAKLFQAAMDQTKAGVGNKPIWITETGWPVSGPKEGSAVAGLENARIFWREVGCPRFGNTNVWWFTLQDGAPTIPNPAFGVIGSTLTTKPLYDLSCGDSKNASNTSQASRIAQPSEATHFSEAAHSSHIAHSSEAPHSSHIAHSSEAPHSSQAGAPTHLPGVPTSEPQKPTATSVPRTTVPSAVPGPGNTTTHHAGPSNTGVNPPTTTTSTGKGGNGGIGGGHGNSTHIAPSPGTVTSISSQPQGTATSTSSQPDSTTPASAGSKLSALAAVAFGVVVAVAAV
ncbi:hypothetical protein ED733_000446 [Metarhizium rileyi]|uniref:Probable glucan endo-1,3-beta-glucosidase eglC n=1 Tax=Metarhizium rileyi (strain RCEF 4871) TaxID=1649241 RepID=A0A5C6G6R0_METRR|nr:hypothetical protein ED733_000446 [Metarhizium rileyi]